MKFLKMKSSKEVTVTKKWLDENGEKMGGNYRVVFRKI